MYVLVFCNPLEVSTSPSASFVLFLKNECFHPLVPPPPPPETPTFQNSTMRSRWAHTCYTHHKYCCTPSVALVQMVLGYGSNACLHHSKTTYTCTCVPRAVTKLTRRERDPSTPHPCTTAPSSRHRRGSALTVASAGSSPASLPWPTHPSREASMRHSKISPPSSGYFFGYCKFPRRTLMFLRSSGIRSRTELSRENFLHSLQRFLVLRIERSEVLNDLLLQSTSCCSLLFTSNVAGRLPSAGAP